MKTNRENNAGSAQVPHQQTGSQMNAVEEVRLSSVAEAEFFFKTVKKRLLDVNHWEDISGTSMSAFVLMDSSGNSVSRVATTGDYIRVDIPGPGTKTGGGYDWVLIEEIKTESLDGAEVLSMRVRPAPNPLTDDKHIAHFLTDEATSTFQVKRVGDMVYADEHGRNESANTDTGHSLDNLRNAVVGWAAKLGFSYPQWKALVKGLLDTENQYK